MKNTFGLIVAVFSFLFIHIGCASTKGVVSKELVQSQELLDKLKAIPSVKEVNVLKICDHFIEHYEIWFEQKVDPQKKNSSTFRQRVLLAHASTDAPVIVELQGYQIHSLRSGELAELFQGNQITIEHRFFAESKPDGGIPWDQLTISNAASDQHLIIEELKKAIYPNNKFVTTGISKGGQTTMIHRSMYPKDVDASVCYVAPLNFEREDTRIYHFLDTVGTNEQRFKIREFQNLCFERKATMIDLLEKKAEENEYLWDVDLERALELYVLEYSFAFWQWGAYSFDQIPDEGATSDSILNHMLNVSGVSFFESKGVANLRPFFWAALTELGMYGYDYEPFKDYLSKKEVYTFDFTFPEGNQKEFNPIAMQKVNDYIQKDATQMMFIYGGLDTWVATAVQLSDEAKKRDLKKHVLSTGHHGTRIRHFEKNKQKEIIETLENWMQTKVN
ncbi:MAG: aminopeptidase [Crocinitomicaceae bacterium]|nr:aminopeptidase [Crocinitomicaceae bacterium]